MSIRTLLTEDVIVPDMTARDKKAALSELCDRLADQRAELDRSRMLSVLLDRERLGSTGIGQGVAIPHGKLAEIDGLIAGFGRSKAGVDFASMDEQPAHLFFVLFAPVAAARMHIDALSRVSRILQDPKVRAALMEAQGPAEILSVIEDAEERIETT